MLGPQIERTSSIHCGSGQHIHTQEQASGGAHLNGDVIEGVGGVDGKGNEDDV